MNKIFADICVIGAGSGGLSVASAASQLGINVVLLEGNKMGGDCLNYGCIPSKSLIAASKSAHALTKGEPFGVKSVYPEVDFSKVKAHISNVIKKIEPHDSVERFEKLGVKVIRHTLSCACVAGRPARQDHAAASAKPLGRRGMCAHH